MDKCKLKKSLIYSHMNGKFYWVGTGRRNRFSEVGVSMKKHHSGKSYIFVNVLNRVFLAHRLAWFLYYGEFPKGQIDHIDGDSSNNSIHNLRVVTHSENQRNMRLSKANTSGICGVCWDKNRCKWSAKIKFSGRHVNLGRYHDFFEACCARKSAEKRFGFHKNHGSQRPL